MAVDKSLSQYQQDLLEGTTLGALRKAGVVSPQIPVQTPKVDIRWQTPKVGDMKPAEEISFQPAAEIKTASPFKLPTAKGLASFDQKKYNDLARAFYNQTAKQAMDDPNLEYVSKFLNRPYGPRTVDRDSTTGFEESPELPSQKDFNYLTSSLTSGMTLPSLNTALAPFAQTSNEGATSFSDTQMENIYENADSDTKTFITNAIDKVDDIYKGGDKWGIGDMVKIGLTSAGRNYAQKTVGGALAKELGFAGAVGGPVGMFLGWLAGKLFDKFAGVEKETKTPPWAISFDKTDDKDDTVEDKIKEQIKKQEEIWDRDDVDPADRGFVPVGTYGGNEVYSSEGISVDSKTGEITNADGTYGGNIVDEFVSETAPAPAPAPAPSHIGPSNEGSDNGGGGGGWSGSGGRSDDSWSSSPFLKGGRVDKALTGGSKDI